MTRNDINFTTVDLNVICSEKTFEICAIKLNTKTIKSVHVAYTDLHPEICTIFF
jgi:hypothetical protein